MAMDFDDVRQETGESAYTSKLYLCPEVRLQPSFVNKEITASIASRARPS